MVIVVTTVQWIRWWRSRHVQILLTVSGERQKRLIDVWVGSTRGLLVWPAELGGRGLIVTGSTLWKQTGGWLLRGKGGWHGRARLTKSGIGRLIHVEWRGRGDIGKREIGLGQWPFIFVVIVSITETTGTTATTCRVWRIGGIVIIRGIEIRTIRWWSSIEIRSIVSLRSQWIEVSRRKTFLKRSVGWRWSIKIRPSISMEWLIL